MAAKGMLHVVGGRIELAQTTGQLDLSGFDLPSVPPVVFNIKHLKYLDLAGNQLKTLPREIGELRQLTTLNLVRNQLKTLPKEIGELRQLTTLNVGKNYLTTLPKEIGELKKLISLKIHGPLTTLPKEIGELKQLHTLSLYGQLTTLPKEIGELKQLISMNLFGNLKTLPREIGELKQLISLNLNGNQLKTMPKEIGELKRLTSLSLWRNQLTTLPKEIGGLKQLTKLNLANNQLTTLPKEIGGFQQLTELNLANNQLTMLPKEIWGLKQLTELNLANNQLTMLPKEIGELRQLTKLNLATNQLTTLPKEVGELTKLDRLFLHDNEMLGIDVAVLGPSAYDFSINNKQPAHPSDILNHYFAKQAEGGGKPLNEVKILLVGAGKVGKSTIVEKLIHNTFDKDKDEETPGIAIDDMPLTVEGTKVTAHVWDFAGQEITHETHRFFLTERSLYLVVLEKRRDQEMQDAQYWLEHIKRYGKDSPVIVVLNKSEKPWEINEQLLLRDHPNIKGFVSTACSKKNGCDALRKKIEEVVATMDSVRATWPPSHLKVKAELGDRLKAGDHAINYQEYVTICKRHGVDTAEKQAGLSRNLHDIGAALWYGDDPRLRDTRVLRPNWVANGLYGIIRGAEKNPKKRPAGEVHENDVAALLKAAYPAGHARGVQASDYPAGCYSFLLKLLVDRDLALPIGERNGVEAYLLPGLLPLAEPAPNHFNVEAAIKDADVRFRYSFQAPPSFFMAPFIVRTSSMSENTPRWKHGVVLRWRDGAEGLVVMNARTNTVNAYVGGGTLDRRHELCDIIRSNARSVQAGVAREAQGVEELEPADAPEQWQEVELLATLSDARTPMPVRVKGSLVMLDPGKELARLSAPIEILDPEQPVRVFVSYAHANDRQRRGLQPFLTVLERSGVVATWQDVELKPDDMVHETITRQLEASDVVIMLISINFLASWFVETYEIPIAVKNHKAGKCRVLPVVLVPTTALDDHKDLGPLNPQPRESGWVKPISKFAQRSDGWNEVYKALRKMVDEVRAKRKGRG